jgi:hypothetical protein
LLDFISYNYISISINLNLSSLVPILASVRHSNARFLFLLGSFL